MWSSSSKGSTVMPEIHPASPRLAFQLRPSRRVYIVILNWNGWSDTIECLESVLRLEGQEVCVVVCDNASSDGSMEQIAGWARGEVRARSTSFLSFLPIAKPLAFRRYTREVAESGPNQDASLVFIDNGGNLGFAGGCNVGIRYALSREDCSHVWMLNNDSVVPSDTLAKMVALCRQRPSVGICGSQVRYYDNPSMVQTFGGLLNPWFCTTHTIACGVHAVSVTAEPEKIDFVPGASMLVTRAFLQKIGLMSERYFLYFEEADWAERAKGRFELAVCLDGLVYHRGAASIGSPTEGGERGIRSEYFLLRGRVLFAQKFYRTRMITVYFGLMVSIMMRLRRCEWLRAQIALCAMVGVKPASLKAYGVR